MTTKDLELDVGILCDGELIESEGLFITSVNRALRKLYTDREIVRTVRFASHSIPAVQHYDKITCINGEAITIPINGLAISMRVHGVGKYTLTDGDSTSIVSFDSPNEAMLIKRALTYGGSITFWGSFSFTVYDLTVYDRIYSQYPDDIPDYGPRRVFDLRKLYNDFMCFISPATDKYGRMIEDCRLYDGMLEINSDYDGEIVITYRRLPCEIITLDVETDIDVPVEYRLMLVLLVASNILYYSNEERSRYYLGRYEELLKGMKESSYQRIEHSYVDTNGWA